MIAVLLLGGCQPDPSLEVPVADPRGLAPQLAAYLEAKVVWVREGAADPERHATLGIAYAANQLWPQAWQCFSNVARLKPAEPLAVMYLAVATQELGDLAGARAQLQALTERFPTFAPGFYRRGELALRAGALDEAEQAFRRLTELAPREWRGYAGAGEVALRRNAFKDAVVWLEQAVRMQPRAAPAHHVLGLAYRALGRTEEAELELRLGANTLTYPMPDAWGESAHQHMLSPQDQIDRAEQYVQTGRPELAVSLLREAVHFEPTNSALLQNLAAACAQTGDISQATNALDRLLMSEPSHVAALVTYSFVLQSAEKPQEALVWADKAVALAPRSAQAHLARANALLAAERDLEALAALRAAAECEPKDPGIQVEMGTVLLVNLKQDQEALRCFQRAAELDPLHVGAQLRLAEYWLSHGNVGSAAGQVARLRRIQPDLPELAELERRLQAAKESAATP